MWETTVVCKACEGTHLVCAEIIPRAFAFECPETKERVDMRFRDPTRMPSDWAEVSKRSPIAVEALMAEARGQFDG